MRTRALALLLLAEIAFFSLVSGQDLSSFGPAARYFQSYFADLTAQAAPVLLLAFGMTLVIMTAGIDLSVASMTALIACVMASCNAGPAFWWTAVPLGLLTGLLLGLGNGVLIARFDVPPIVATLGTMIFYRGLCFVVMGDAEKAPFVEVPGYEWFGTFLGALVVCGVVYLAGGGWLARSRWLQEVLMIGGNRVAARYAAIAVDRRLVQTYALLGVLSFAAAVCFTARNSSVSASSLTGMELHVIVAVVLGGARVQGGSGSFAGTFMGVLLIASLDEGLRGAAVWGAKYLPFKISHLEYLCLGSLLILGVWLNTRPRRPATPVQRV